MATTPQQVSVGASGFNGVSDKLDAIIFLLNTSNMTAQQIAVGASTFNGVSQKLDAIIFLLANGGAGGGAQNGTGTPSTNGLPANAGSLYINNTDSTLWAVSNGAWIQLV